MEVGVWIKGGQQYKDQEVKDIADFQKRFEAWWFDLQPAARSKGGSLLPATSGIDWKKLNKAGKSGFVLVMLALTWWRAACGEISSARWEWAVSDVAEALRHVQKLPLITESRKRAVPDDPNPTSPPSKRVSR